MSSMLTRSLWFTYARYFSFFLTLYVTKFLYGAGCTKLFTISCAFLAYHIYHLLPARKIQG